MSRARTGRAAAVHCAFAISAFAAMLLEAAPAHSQVDVEPFRERLSTQGFGGELSGSVTTFGGNSRGIVLGATGLVGFRAARHFAYLSASSDYARLDGEVDLAKAFVHARYNYELYCWLWAELFAQTEADKFRRIRARELVGAGPRLGIVDDERVQLFYGGAYMLEYTRRSNDVEERDRSVVAHRFSNYVALSYTPEPRISLGSTTYYQPRFDAPSDYRLLSVLGAELKVSESVSARIDATVRYESRVPASVEPFDGEVKNSLTFKL